MTSIDALKQAVYEHSDNTLGFPNNEYLQVLNDIAKEFKALEIIKDKKVKIEWNSGSLFLTPATYLTDEEYDLLKEVLK